MNIVGLDIGRGVAVACLIDDSLAEIKDFVEAYHALDTHELPADRWGIAALLSLQPDAIALEPTGGHYAKLWAESAAAAGVEIYWIGHSQLANFRSEIGLADKTDSQDAFALACYLQRYREQPNRFIRRRCSLALELRALGLRLQHLDRCRSPHINYLRQLLSWQFPEASAAGLQRSDGKPTALLNFVADDGNGSGRWPRVYSASVGTGLQPAAIFEAQQARSLCLEEWRAAQRLRELLAATEFEPYRRVLNAFRIPPKSQAILISQIYPLSDFLDPSGAPIVRRSKGKKSKTKTKKHLSRRRFEKAIGCAPRERSSGKKESKSQRVGSALCRKHLWLWVLSLEKKQHPLKLSDPDAIAIRERLNSLKSAGVPAPLARGRVAGDAARKLFYRLVKELAKS